MTTILPEPFDPNQEPTPQERAAQPPAMPVIGFLGSESFDLYTERLRAFHRGLRETGLCRGPQRGIGISLGRGRVRSISYAAG
jgi:hypothetical protein